MLVLTGLCCRVFGWSRVYAQDLTAECSKASEELAALAVRQEASKAEAAAAAADGSGEVVPGAGAGVGVAEAKEVRPVCVGWGVRVIASH